MLFFIRYTDKPGAAAIRAANRQAHLDYVIGRYGEATKLAGPTLAADGETMEGSVLILDLPDRAAAEVFVAEDPYTRAGLFESTVIRPFRKAIG